MYYQSYKNRSIDLSQKVMVYKNLHNGLFSVKQNGLVVAHVKNLVLTNVSFSVSESGRQRVIQEKRKNVHAYVIGEIVDINREFLDVDSSIDISYNPYKFKYFYNKVTNEKVELNSEQMLTMCVNEGLFIIT